MTGRPEIEQRMQEQEEKDKVFFFFCIFSCLQEGFFGYNKAVEREGYEYIRRRRVFLTALGEYLVAVGMMMLNAGLRPSEGHLLSPRGLLQDGLQTELWAALRRIQKMRTMQTRFNLNMTSNQAISVFKTHPLRKMLCLRHESSLSIVISLVNTKDSPSSL